MVVIATSENTRQIKPIPTKILVVFASGDGSDRKVINPYYDTNDQGHLASFHWCPHQGQAIHS